MATNKPTPHLRNIGTAERLASVAGGAALAWYGARRRDRLGVLLAALGGGLAWRGVRGHSALYRRLGAWAFGGTTTEPAVKGVGIHVTESVVVMRPVTEVHAYWRQLDNLPRFMKHLVRVTPFGPKLSHWEARAPLGKTVEWDAEIIEDDTPWVLSWRSMPGSQIPNAGSVHFGTAGPRETEVRVSLAYKPPVGPLGALFARALGEEPQVQVREDLRRFKEILERETEPLATGA